MNKHVWILYPCAARKTLSKVCNRIKMMEQYAQQLNYKVEGYRILEKSYLNDDDYAIIRSDMEKHECSILLLENIHLFCRNEETLKKFKDYMQKNDICIHSIKDDG